MNNNSNTRYEIQVVIYSEFYSTGDPVISSGTTYLLDTYESEMVTFDMSVNEVQDISQRNSTYSKTITLPDTDNNRVIFGYVSDLIVDTYFFNPNKRAACTILVDTLPIYIGTLQLKRVVTNYKSGEVKYDAIFFSSVNDFYKNMGERYLTDLTGGATAGAIGVTSGLNRYNHTYNWNSIENSWLNLNPQIIDYGTYQESVTNPESIGYYYPLIDYGRTLGSASLTELATGISAQNRLGTWSAESILQYIDFNSVTFLNIDQMYPSVYVKVIVDEIFAEAGYQYESEFFNTPFFKRLIIPFSNKFLKAPNYSYPDFNFQPDSGLSVGPGTMTASVYDWGSYTNPLSHRDFYFESLSFSQSSTLQPQIYPQQTFTFSQNGIFTVDFKVNAPYFENITNQVLYYKPKVSLSFLGDGIFKNNLVALRRNKPRIVWASKRIGDTKAYEISHYDISANTNSFLWNDTTNIAYSVGYIDTSLFTPAAYNPNFNSRLKYGYLPMEPGEKSFIFIELYNNPSLLQRGTLVLNLFKNIFAYPSSSPYAFSIQNQFLNQVLEGGTVNIPLNLPANIKQKDFMTNLYKMFNLYVEADKEIPNLLRIKPRDEYYKKDSVTGGVVIKDWTEKIDLDQEITMDILSDIQNKTFRYTYQLDGDYYNRYYSSFTNRTQGDAIKEIDNDFAVGENKFDIIFGASVLANIPNSNIFPIVNTAQQISETQGFPVGSSDMSIRILQVQKITSETIGYPYFNFTNLSIGDFFSRVGTSSVTPLLDDYYSIVLNVGPTGPTNTEYIWYTGYPYAGNFDSPYNPTSDLSFSQQLVSFFPESTIVNDNLYNTYHEQQFKEFSDINGRILTCEMYLNPQDIHDFYFNHIIYLQLGGQGDYWRVNSIKNYDISGRSTCTVELIRALYPAVQPLPGNLEIPSGIPIYTTTTTTTTSTTTTTTTIGYYMLTINYNAESDQPLIDGTTLRLGFDFHGLSGSATGSFDFGDFAGQEMVNTSYPIIGGAPTNDYLYQIGSGTVSWTFSFYNGSQWGTNFNPDVLQYPAFYLWRNYENLDCVNTILPNGFESNFYYNNGIRGIYGGYIPNPNVSLGCSGSWTQYNSDAQIYLPGFPDTSAPAGYPDGWLIKVNNGDSFTWDWRDALTTPTTTSTTTTTTTLAYYTLQVNYNAESQQAWLDGTELRLGFQFLGLSGTTGSIDFSDYYGQMMVNTSYPTLYGAPTNDYLYQVGSGTVSWTFSFYNGSQWGTTIQPESFLYAGFNLNRKYENISCNGLTQSAGFSSSFFYNGGVRGIYAGYVPYPQAAIGCSGSYEATGIGDAVYVPGFTDTSAPAGYPDGWAIKVTNGDTFAWDWRDVLYTNETTTTTSTTTTTTTIQFFNWGSNINTSSVLPIICGLTANVTIYSTSSTIYYLETFYTDTSLTTYVPWFINDRYSLLKDPAGLTYIVYGNTWSGGVPNGQVTHWDLYSTICNTTTTTSTTTTTTTLAPTTTTTSTTTTTTTAITTASVTLNYYTYGANGATLSYQQVYDPNAIILANTDYNLISVGTTQSYTYLIPFTGSFPTNPIFYTSGLTTSSNPIGLTFTTYGGGIYRTASNLRTALRSYESYVNGVLIGTASTGPINQILAGNIYGYAPSYTHKIVPGDSFVYTMKENIIYNSTFSFAWNWYPIYDQSKTFTAELDGFGLQISNGSTTQSLALPNYDVSTTTNSTMSVFSILSIPSEYNINNINNFFSAVYTDGTYDLLSGTATFFVNDVVVGTQSYNSSYDSFSPGYNVFSFPVDSNFVFGLTQSLNISSGTNPKDIKVNLVTNFKPTTTTSTTTTTTTIIGGTTSFTLSPSYNLGWTAISGNPSMVEFSGYTMPVTTNQSVNITRGLTSGQQFTSQLYWFGSHVTFPLKLNLVYDGITIGTVSGVTAGTFVSTLTQNIPSGSVIRLEINQ